MAQHLGSCGSVFRFLSGSIVVGILCGLMPVAAEAAGGVNAVAASRPASSIGEAAPQASTPKIFAKAYGSWVYRCVQVTPPGKSAVTECQVMQQMVLNQGGHSVPLITLALAKTSDGSGYALSAIAPLGIFLPPGVLFWADDNAPVTAALDFCNADGCVALPQPAPGLSAEFKAGKQGHAKLVLTNGHAVTVNFSLSGFSEALTALDSGALPPVAQTSSKDSAHG